MGMENSTWIFWNSQYNTRHFFNLIIVQMSSIIHNTHFESKAEKLERALLFAPKPGWAADEVHSSVRTNTVSVG